jgi:hypothetical protein
LNWQEEYPWYCGLGGRLEKEVLVPTKAISHGFLVQHGVSEGHTVVKFAELTFKVHTELATKLIVNVVSRFGDERQIQPHNGPSKSRESPF